jgi:hypothetical protein
MLPFAIVFLTALSAFLGAPWWVVLACACGLFGTSPLRRENFSAQLSVGPMDSAIGARYLMSAAHAVAAGSAAYGLGFLVRLAFNA